MRFLADGADVPNELVAAHERGEVLFICGAGVSVTSGLPLFRGLVEEVYRRLNEDWRPHHAEAGVMQEAGPLAHQYDRMLRALERRLAGGEQDRLRKMRDQIRRAVAAALTPPAAADLTHHRIVLDLSRDQEARTRVVTTNFDTLFERAWRETGAPDLPSHAGPALPQPRGASFSGVLHLHGRVLDEELKLSESEFVLTSAEFGDAYLRTGWASRYVYDLARSYVLVFVGYGADDPPMRYLLEALEADRERYRDLKKPYAFAHAAAGQEAPQQALWRAKGVEPIFYSDALPTGHGRLYETLRAWGQYANDPTSWRRERLRALMVRTPAELGPGERAEVVAHLGHRDADRLLRDLAPAACWLPFLRKEGVFSPQRETRPSEATWLAHRLADEEMIRTCAEAPPYEPDDLRMLARAIDGAEALSPVHRKAWRFIRQAGAQRSIDPFPRWYLVKSRVKTGDIDHEVREAVITMLRPRLQVRKPYGIWMGAGAEGTEAPARVRDLVRVEFEPLKGAQTEIGEVLSCWPNSPEEEAALLRMASRAVEDALEEANDAGLMDSYDAVSWGVRSVARRDGRWSRGGFEPLVQLTAALWERVAPKEAGLARSLAEWWGRSPFNLGRRLHLHALVNSTVFLGPDVFQALVRVEDRAFWLSDVSPEASRLLVERWKDLSPEQREVIEARIRSGPPRTLFAPERVNEDRKWEAVRDGEIIAWLQSIKHSGGELGAASVATLDRVLELRPELAPRNRRVGPGADPVASWRGAQGDPRLLTGLPDDALLGEALRLQSESPFEQGELWQVFCEREPERALRALRIDVEAGRWSVPAWRGVLWAAAKQEGEEFQAELANLALGIPPAELHGDLLGELVGWLRTRASLLAPRGARPAPTALALWDLLAARVFAPQSEDPGLGGDEPIRNSDEFNEPGGMLANTLIELLDASKPNAMATFTEQLQSRFDRLVEATGRPGRLARVTMARNLPFLFYVASAWVSERVLPFFVREHAEAGVLWPARLRGSVPQSPSLFNVLKPHLLAQARLPVVERDESRNLAANLLLPALWRRSVPEARDFDIEAIEVKKALALASSEVRHDAAFLLFDWIRQEKDPAERWNSAFGPFFREVWPMDIAARAPITSEYLAWMALECGDAFPDALRAILHALVPFEIYTIDVVLKHDARRSETARRYPLEFVELLDAIIDPAVARAPDDLAVELAACVLADPSIESRREYQRLLSISRRASA